MSRVFGIEPGTDVSEMTDWQLTQLFSEFGQNDEMRQVARERRELVDAELRRRGIDSSQIERVEPESRLALALEALN